jgi:hypothetical protein
MATEPSVPPGALAFSREVYASTMDWYKVADSKGQLLLALNGVYITVLSSVTIASSQQLVKIRASLPLVTGVLLASAAVATATSILMAIACLYSRLSDARTIQAVSERDEQGRLRYRPSALYWFAPSPGWTVASGWRCSGRQMRPSSFPPSRRIFSCWRPR